MAVRRRKVRKNEARREAVQANDRRRRRVHDIYGAHIFNARLAERPLNPFFVTSTNVRRKSELYIPMDLVQRTVVDIPRRAVLVDQQQRPFQLRRIEWNGGRLLYIGGWKKFCRVNRVRDRDEIILEFVRGNDGSSIIRAVIIRAR